MNYINSVLNIVNENIGVITLISVVSVFVIYFKKRRDEKKDAARIILQEIRRAELILREYIEFDGFKFRKRIIAVNSWSNNIYLFVDVFDQDELDRISNLYSTGEFIDRTIQRISDLMFTDSIAHTKAEAIEAAKKADGENKPEPSRKTITMDAPWKSLFDQILKEHEFINNTPITDKLKRLAKF